MTLGEIHEISIPSVEAERGRWNDEINALLASWTDFSRSLRGAPAQAQRVIGCINELEGLRRRLSKESGGA